MDNSTIILGYERLGNGKEWALNGRITPSTITATTEEKNRFNEFESDFYDTFFNPTGKANSINDVFDKAATTQILKKSINDIKDEKYLYVITIHSFILYIKYTSHIAISDKVRNDVLKGQAKIVFCYHHEGDCFIRTKMFEQFKKLILELNLPKKQIYFVHGDLNSDNFIDQPYTYVPINVFPFWLLNYRFTPRVNYNPNKLFLNYNRILRPHRIVFTSMLNDEQLLDDCIFSFGNLSQSDFLAACRHFPHYPLIEKYDTLKELANTSDDHLDISKVNPATQINLTHYQNTFLSLVSETIAHDTVRFISEKLFKPICIGHPFIVIGSPFLLAELKKQNYKTFNEFWDESYDLETDPYLRFQKIIRILKQIKTYSLTELKELRVALDPILEHNKQIFQQYTIPMLGLFFYTGLFRTFKQIYTQ